MKMFCVVSIDNLIGEFGYPTCEYERPMKLSQCQESTMMIIAGICI